MEDSADCVQGKEGVLEYRCYTFQNNTDNPLLFFRRGAVVYSLHNFRLHVAGRLGTLNGVE